MPGDILDANGNILSKSADARKLDLDTPHTGLVDETGAPLRGDTRDLGWEGDDRHLSPVSGSSGGKAEQLSLFDTDATAPKKLENLTPVLEHALGMDPLELMAKAGVPGAQMTEIFALLKSGDADKVGSWDQVLAHLGGNDEAAKVVFDIQKAAAGDYIHSQSNKNTDQPLTLYVGSGPKGLAKLDLSAEQQGIAKHSDNLVTVSNPIASEFHALIASDKADHLVVGGHGEADGIMLSDQNMAAQKVTGPELVKMVQSSDRLQSILLSVCHGADGGPGSIADLLSKTGKTALGYDGPVYDSTAIKMTELAAKYISEGHSAAEAFTKAKHEYEAANPVAPDHIQVHEPTPKQGEQLSLFDASEYERKIPNEYTPLLKQALGMDPLDIIAKADVPPHLMWEVAGLISGDPTKAQSWDQIQAKLGDNEEAAKVVASIQKSAAESYILGNAKEGTEKPISLWVGSQPTDVAQLNLDKELGHINQNLENVVNIKDPTPAELQAMLQANLASNLILSGHGHPGEVVLTGQGGTKQTVSGKDLVQMIQDSPQLQAVMLNICHGETTKGDNTLAGMLSETGVTTLGYQGPVYDSTAIEMANLATKYIQGGMGAAEAFQKAKQTYETANPGAVASDHIQVRPGEREQTVKSQGANQAEVGGPRQLSLFDEPALDTPTQLNPSLGHGYREGLQTMMEQLDFASPSYLDATLAEGRLLGNLNGAEGGETAMNRSSRGDILDDLNRIGLESLGQPFHAMTGVDMLAHPSFEEIGRSVASARADIPASDPRFTQLMSIEARLQDNLANLVFNPGSHILASENDYLQKLMEELRRKRMAG